MEIYYSESSTGFTTPNWGGIDAYPLSPLSAPIEPTAVIGDMEVTLSWTAPNCVGGLGIEHYIIYQNGIEVATTTNATIAIGNLSNGVSYNFTIAAVTIFEIGPQSEILTAIPEQQNDVVDDSSGISEAYAVIVGIVVVITLLAAFLIVRKRKR